MFLIAINISLITTDRDLRLYDGEESESKCAKRFSVNKRHRRWDFCLGTKLLLLFIFLQQNTKQNSICIDDDSVNWSLFQTKYFHLKKLSFVTWKLRFFPKNFWLFAISINFRCYKYHVWHPFCLSKQ